jgi:hypothetical protein
VDEKRRLRLNTGKGKEKEEGEIGMYIVHNGLQDFPILSLGTSSELSKI